MGQEPMESASTSSMRHRSERSTPVEPGQRQTLTQVQVLRALAATSVALRHAQHDAASLELEAGRTFQAWNPIPWSAGVDIFFVISGLIMVHTSRQLFAKTGGARLFLSRRIARIIPLYWSVTTLYLVVALLAPTFLNQTYINSRFVIESYFFIPATRPDGVVQPLYELGWTLNYEMLFYVLFAAAIVLPMRWAVTVLLTTLVGMVFAGRLAAPLREPFAFWTDPIILEFALGVMVGIMCASGLRPSGLIRACVAATGLAALMLAAAFPEISVGIARPVVYGIPASLIVWSAALAPSELRHESRAARWGAGVGDASFALYLLHPFVIRAMRIIFWRTGLILLLGPWTFIALALATTFGVALITYRLFEKPLTGRARRLLGVGSGARQQLRPFPVPAYPKAD
ncbi:acyltransferase [Mesorhizobium sp. NZP2234]|uniref:acyltransferase family protein n=1 Tax=Mesorhizobium sp. NZP2234 TaxID=2483402 RepID=UPI0015562B1D|nr:acyltransferase [Mesorhizobium sp. NZP2234]QKC92008.1 acyltransferase [Mesorhizobium sp. NZP2234]